MTYCFRNKLYKNRQNRIESVPITLYETLFFTLAKFFWCYYFEQFSGTIFLLLSFILANSNVWKLKGKILPFMFKLFFRLKQDLRVKVTQHDGVCPTADDAQNDEVMEGRIEKEKKP